MSISVLSPTLAAPLELGAVLRLQGYGVLDARSVSDLSACSAAQLVALRPLWNDLPPDAFLRDGGHYRRRRHACFVVEGESVTQMPHRAHWQPVKYNALHGGMQRLFEPILPEMIAQPVWNPLLTWLGSVCSELKGVKPWFVEVHQFRIDTTDGIGRPTPEGAHRDGVDMVAVFLVNRDGV